MIEYDHADRKIIINNLYIINDRNMYKLVDNYIYWYGGIWQSGTWRTGDWLDGTWKSGFWTNGVWHNGEWKHGIWNNGTWKNGTWHNGVWKNGWWNNGIWVDGEWGKGGILNPITNQYEYSKSNPIKFYKKIGWEVKT